MFGRSNWAVIGIDPATFPVFEQSLNDAALMLANSQLAAQSVARMRNIPAIGINPFDRPRMDDIAAPGVAALSGVDMTRLADFAGQKAEERNDGIIDSLEIGELFAYGAKSFRIAEDAKRFGFWLVYNDAKDVGDTASLKEHKAYTTTFKPYKFLSSAEKKAIETDAKAITAGSRKQYPVLIDFESGRAYIEATSKATIFMLRQVLELLGVQTQYMAWRFDGSDWMRVFLARVLEESRYKDYFRKRAEESTRFNGQEIEALEDAELEGIVSDFFAMTQAETEDWIGLRAPATIMLYPNSNSVVASSPTTATLLLDATSTAHVYGAPVAFQERRTYIKKKTGEERVYRETVFTLEVSDGMNEVESGAALLRGFDLPRFKRTIQREIRKNKEVPALAYFWHDWLVAMNNSIASFTAAVNAVLEIDGERASSGGIQRTSNAENDEVIEGGE